MEIIFSVRLENVCFWTISGSFVRDETSLEDMALKRITVINAFLYGGSLQTFSPGSPWGLFWCQPGFPGHDPNIRGNLSTSQLPYYTYYFNKYLARQSPTSHLFLIGCCDTGPTTYKTPPYLQRSTNFNLRRLTALELWLIW